MAQLKIRTLGAFQISIDGEPVTNFDSNKVRALFAYLVTEVDRPHDREKLTELFWPDMPAKRAKSNLSQALYNLRRLISDHQAAPAYLLRTREAVQFNPQADYWLDVDAFKSRLCEAPFQSNTPPDLSSERIDRLMSAIELYAGDFLDGLTFDSSPIYDEWVLIIRQRLQRLAMGSLHLLANYYGARGEIEAALPYAWRQVELEPLDEAACRQLMHLLDAYGRRNQALAQYQRLHVLLSEELNVAPQPETIALRDRIRGEAYDLGLSKRVPGNLPAHLTPIIGRERELAELQKCLGKPGCRLLTILGPGGSGKSRLSLELARSNQERYRHGAFFIPLNPLQSHGSILPALMEALSLQPQTESEPQSQLANYLRNKDVLLVLDGFEHLLAGAAALVEILHQAPGLNILVTSRSKLSVKDEHVYLLAGMSYPVGAATEVEIIEADAVQLLLQGLQQARHVYEPTPTDLEHLLQICRSVQGMPLGILLAASWGATLSLEDISKEVNRSLDFLTAEWNDVPARQRSMRATFEHSWNLLSEREQTIFQSLAVFRGAFTRRAAKEVVDASPYELRALVDRSLLWNKSSGWFEMHELLRQYSREKLAEVEGLETEVCSRYGTYYLQKLALRGELLKNEQQVAAMENIDLEHENYRAAWNRAAAQAVSGELSNALEAMCLYYDLSLRYQDGQSACQIAIQGLTQDQRGGKNLLLLVRLLTWQSRFTRLLGKLDAACGLLDQAQILLEKSGLALNSTVAGFYHLEKGDHHFLHDRTAAAECYQKSLQIYRSLDDLWGTAKALTGLGLVAHHAGKFQEAVKIYSESLDLHRSLGDPRGIADASINLGQNSLRLGLIEIGESYINEGATVLQKIGNKAGVARGCFELARYYFWIGEFARSCQLNERAIPIFEELGMLNQYNFASIGLGLGFSHQGKYAQAITAAVKGIPLAQELEARREISLINMILGMAYLGQGEYKRAENWALKSVKQYRDINQQEELSLALSLLVYTQLGFYQYQQAKEYLCEMLQIGISIDGVFPILYSLYAAALFLADRGEVEEALEITTLALRYPFIAKSCWFEDIAGREIAAASASLAPEEVAAAQERGRKLDLWDTAEALLKELSEPKHNDVFYGPRRTIPSRQA